MTAVLERTFTPECLTPPPAIHFGPVWEEDPLWDGGKAGHYILPRFTLGWQQIRWVTKNLLDDEGKPFKLTQEQSRFILWMYAINERGEFLYREIILQRLKGWGKDPLASVICALEFVGPCRFKGWASSDRYRELGVLKGDPIAKSHPRAWIQIAAVNLAQTKNTMLLFPGLFTKECIKEHTIDLGKEVIYAHGGQRQIAAVTSSPRALEGGRPTLVILNETHHWLSNNDGHAMYDVIERNVVKSKDGAARTLSITNAYEPSENSVAQQQRESWEDEAAGLSIDTGVMYDSLEANLDARIVMPRIPDGISETGEPLYREATEIETKTYIGAIVEGVRGDATWLNIKNIVNSILNKKNPISRSRRFFYNQVMASENAWAHPAAIRAAIDPLAEDARTHGGGSTRDSWLVGPDEPCVMFLDGSKSEDSTGLVGCRLSDGYVFTIGIWQKPKGERGALWLVDRWAVDARVNEAHERFKIVAFFADPSHALDDDDDTRYWDEFIDRWHRKFKDRYLLWAIKTGEAQHSVMWDMTSPARGAAFVAAAERFISELETMNDVEEYAPTFKIDGHPALVNHLRNAKKYPHPKGYGVSLFKGAREKSKKIDLAVCAVGARMLRRLVLNAEKVDDKPRTGVVW